MYKITFKFNKNTRILSNVSRFMIGTSCSLFVAYKDGSVEHIEDVEYLEPMDIIMGELFEG